MKTWTEEQKLFLIYNYDKLPHPVLAKAMRRSVNAIRSKMSRLGETTVKYKRWSREETKFLEDNADKMLAKQIAASLGKTTEAVLSRAAYLKIRLTFYRGTYNHEDAELCFALHKEGLSIPVIAEKMEMKPEDVATAIRRLS